MDKMSDGGGDDMSVSTAGFKDDDGAIAMGHYKSDSFIHDEGAFDASGADQFSDAGATACAALGKRCRADTAAGVSVGVLRRSEPLQHRGSGRRRR
jgi:hypothetical protein